MQIPNSARLLLGISLLLSSIGLGVGGYQAVEIWRMAFSGGHFGNVGEGMSVFDWTLLGAAWLLPLTFATFAMRRWTLRLRGFPLDALVSSAAWALFLGSTIAVLYLRSETWPSEGVIEDVTVY
jgi:hypothetical protein